MPSKQASHFHIPYLIILNCKTWAPPNVFNLGSFLSKMKEQKSRKVLDKNLDRMHEVWGQRVGGTLLFDSGNLLILGKPHTVGS